MIDPESRSRLLENLAAGLALPKSLASALGIRQQGRAWLEAGRDLEVMRREDAEVRGACEAAERRAEEARDDRAEQGAEGTLASGGQGPQPVRASDVQGGGHGGGVLRRGDHGDLGAGGSGRETGEEASEGEGAVGGQSDVAPVRDEGGARHALTMLDVARAGMVANETREPEPPPRPPNPEAAKWARVRAEAEAKYGPGLFGLLCHQDDLLAARGVHRMGRWWLGLFSAFFAARVSLPTLQWILALAGRGSGKSTTLERLAILVALFAERSMSPNERWQWPFISVLKGDAERRIFEIAKLMQLAYGLDIKVNKADLKIETEDAAGNAIEFLSMASTIGAVSGPSSMGATVDEAAKMRTTGVNPDVELIVSLAETSRARDNWIGVRCSSAWLTKGAHHAAVMRGSNVVNFVAVIGVEWIDIAIAGYAEVAAWEAAQGNAKGGAQIRAWARTLHAWSPNVPTWVANPTIGALASRVLLETVPRDAEDEDIDATTYWLRECGSMPLTGDGGFSAEAQLQGLAERNEALAAVMRGEPAVRVSGGDVEPMKLRGMRPGDARYAGDAEPMRRGPLPGWDKGNVF